MNADNLCGRCGGIGCSSCNPDECNIAPPTAQSESDERDTKRVEHWREFVARTYLGESTQPEPTTDEALIAKLYLIEQATSKCSTSDERATLRTVAERLRTLAAEKKAAEERAERLHLAVCTALFHMQPTDLTGASSEVWAARDALREVLVLPTAEEVVAAARALQESSDA